MLIQVGPARASGGIAEAMRVIDGWARSAGQPVRTINTSCDGSLPKRVVIGVAGILRAMGTMLANPHALVHVHMASKGSFLRKSVVVAAAHCLRHPLVLQIHGGGFAAFASGSVWRRRWVASVLKRADVVLVLSAATAKVVRVLQPAVQVEIMPNAATLLCGTSTDTTSRQVLFLGRLGRTKGTDILLTAIDALQRDGVDADWVLAGDGDVEHTHALVARLPMPSRVQVPGWVTLAAVHQLLHQSSILCLPSRFEGLPMALLQAMGHGLACVVTPVGGMADIIVSGVNGVLVPTGDSNGLADVLKELLDNPQWRAQLGKGASATIQRGYTAEVVMERMVWVYREAAARRTGDVGA